MTDERETAPLSPRFATMLHALAHSRAHDDGRGVTLLPDRGDAPEEHRTYGELFTEAAGVAAALQSAGVREGDRVVIVLPTSFEFITTFFGVGLLGAVPVPSYPPAALERGPQATGRLVHVVASAGATLCVTTRRLRLLFGELAAEGVDRFVAVETLERGGDVAIPEVRARPADIAFIQYTSGSTDHPKGVQLSHENLVMNVEAMGTAMRIGASDRGVSWLPLYHDMGLIGGLLTSVYWRMPLALMSPLAFMADPLRWLRTVDAHRGTISPAPNFAYALCTRRAHKHPEQLEGLDLSTWRVALNGAESISRDVLVEFERTFAPAGFRSRAMLPVYGLAEASLAVTFPSVDDEPRWELVDREALADGRAEPVAEDHPKATPVVCVGTALPGHEVLVVDDEGVEVVERVVGNIVTRGPSVMLGYCNEPALTDEVLADGTLWTGDLGYVVDGQLFVTGRTKDLVIVRGRNYAPEELERLAASVPEIRAGGVVAFAVRREDDATEVAVLVCETRVEDANARGALAREVSEVVSSGVGIALAEVVLVAPGTIPKTSSGKPQRGETRQRFLDDTLGAPRAGRLEVAKLFARSGAGFLASGARRLTKKGPDPE